ncbi:MAG TPA: hypothetical protein VN963_02020 [bacterium]|nr:hypothetical protein [bacterium]
MKYAIWILGAIFLIFAASCNVLNPTANQVTVEASVQYGNTCPVGVNLDGNNGVTISDGTYYTFPLVGTGSHTLNFSTSNPSPVPVCAGGSPNCFFSNSGAATYSTTFNTVAGTIYVASVTQSGSNCTGLSVIGPN